MIIVAAIHVIMTGQTDASWPDKFDAWAAVRAPGFKVVKKEYLAGPFPRWNNFIKNPFLARGLVKELQLFADQIQSLGVPIWFVAHSNGAQIAMRATKILIARGYRVAGLILTGAASDGDVDRSKIAEWVQQDCLGTAIAYSSAQDRVVSGDATLSTNPLRKVRDWVWGKLMWPYGCLGRTGWRRNGQEFETPHIFTRWHTGGHSVYFRSGHIAHTFEQIHRDITTHS
jgi:pimeloyl-ACP methyl ester carboxylesterase